MDKRVTKKLGSCVAVWALVVEKVVGKFVEKWWKGSGKSCEKDGVGKNVGSFARISTGNGEFSTLISTLISTGRFELLYLLRMGFCTFPHRTTTITTK